MSSCSALFETWHSSDGADEPSNILISLCPRGLQPFAVCLYSVGRSSRDQSLFLIRPQWDETIPKAEGIFHLKPSRCNS